MIQRLYKSSLSSSFLFDLSSQLLHQPLFISNQTIPIIQEMINIETKLMENIVLASIKEGIDNE